MVKHDTSSYGKPRSTRGTPMAKFTSRLAFVTLGLGLLSAYWFTYTPLTKNLRDALMPLYDDPIEERERKHRMGISDSRTFRKTRRLMEEAEMPNLPHK